MERQEFQADLDNLKSRVDNIRNLTKQLQQSEMFKIEKYKHYQKKLNPKLKLINDSLNIAYFQCKEMEGMLGDNIYKTE